VASGALIGKVLHEAEETDAEPAASA
jgi:hypothetical protein